MTIDQIIAIVLIDVAVVIVVARLTGRLFRLFRQPAVVGEIVGGILLGPTLLGALPGHLDTLLFPTVARPYLMVLAQLGLVLFMFIIGLELNLSYVAGRIRVASAVSLTSIAVPFLLGCGATYFLYAQHSTVAGHRVPFVALALFLGIALSITAFPVLARILTDRGMHRTATGVLALACAAIDDVVAWSLLAIVVAVASGGGPVQVLVTTGLAVAFAIVMFVVVRPLLRRLVDRYHRAGRLTPDILAIVLVGILVSAWITNEIGVHVIFGAFLFGAAMPRANAEAMTREILERLEQVSVLLLLPMFFVVTGLGVNIGALGADGFIELVGILLLAVVGKFAGAAVAARASGVARRQSLALGALMNTRGLTELVILQVGRQLGVLDTDLFTILVIMAVVTTMMTEPLLRWIYPESLVRRDVAAAERAELGEVDVDTVIVRVDDPDTARGLVRLGATLPSRGGRLVLARFMSRDVRSTLEVGSGLGVELDAVAGALEQMHELTAQPGAVDTKTVCRFSSDPRRDLTALARELRAEVVVADDGVAESVERGPWTTVVIPSATVDTVSTGLDATEPVVVLADLGPDGRAALKVAARMSAHSGQPLKVAPLDGGRRGLAHRWRSLAEAMSRADVSAELLVEAPGPVVASWVVVPASAADAGREMSAAAAVIVHAGDDDAQADFEETVTALART